MLDDRDFQRRLRAALGSMKNNAFKGVKLATAHVKLEAQKRTPVDEGNLKASAYTNVSKSSRGLVGTVGFTASYAAAVHEKPMVHAGEKRKGKDAKGKYWDPQGKGSNKFLERAIDENESEILEIVKRASQL